MIRIQQKAGHRSIVTNMSFVNFEFFARINQKPKTGSDPKLSYNRDLKQDDVALVRVEKCKLT